MSNVENVPLNQKPSNNLDENSLEEYQDIKEFLAQENFLDNIENEDIPYSLKNFFKCLYLANETVKYKGVASVSISLKYLEVLGEGEGKDDKTYTSHYIADLSGQIGSMNRMTLADIQKPWQAGSNVSYELRKVSNNNPHLHLLQKVVKKLFCPNPIDFSSQHNNAIHLDIIKNKLDFSLRKFYGNNPFIEAQTNDYFLNKKINQKIIIKNEELTQSTSFKL